MPKRTWPSSESDRQGQKEPRSTTKGEYLSLISLIRFILTQIPGRRSRWWVRSVSVLARNSQDSLGGENRSSPKRGRKAVSAHIVWSIRESTNALLIRWTAVCRGAVLKGLMQNKVTRTLAVAVDSRISRRSYGTLVNVVPFDPKEHHPADQVFCNIQQQFLAIDQTQWFLEVVSRLFSHIEGDMLTDQLRTRKSYQASQSAANFGRTSRIPMTTLKSNLSSLMQLYHPLAKMRPSKRCVPSNSREYQRSTDYLLGSTSKARYFDVSNTKSGWYVTMLRSTLACITKDADWSRKTSPWSSATEQLPPDEHRRCAF